MSLQTIPITEEALAKMPKAMARRLRIGMRPEMLPEFQEWAEDMGYTALLVSDHLQQLLFEAFIGGWGAKFRQLKRKQKSHE